jgi:hypothetical protein
MITEPTTETLDDTGNNIDAALLNGHLDQIDMIIERQVTDTERKQLFKKLAGQIRIRLGSTLLNLAVIGQFSSGKSTFLNAILRRSLLKAMNMASTAAATFIKSGNLLAIQVVFFRDFRINASEYDYHHLREHLERFYHTQLNERTDFLYYLELLTTNEEIAADITHLEITVPSETLFLENTILIDTPGLFAGADYTAGHSEVTQSVIDDIADLVIILLPAHQLISRDLIDFLATLPAYLKKRCAFVLSEIDRVSSDEERAELLEYTRNFLTNRLGIADPVIYSCCALAMLHEGLVISSVSENLSEWQDSFYELESGLRRKLTESRLLVINQKIKCLITSLAGELNRDLTLKKNRLSADEQDIASKKVNRIEEVLAGLLADAKQRIEQARSGITTLLGDTADSIGNVKSSAERKITRAGNDIYDNYTSIESELHEDIRAELKTLVRKVNVKIKNVNELAGELNKGFERQFKANYASLHFLHRTIDVPAFSFDQVQLPGYNFSSYTSLVEAKIEEKDEGGAGGAGLGFLLGLVFFGPIGAIVGAGLGGATGSSMARESLDTLQPKLIRLLKSEIETGMNDSVKAIQKQVKGLFRNLVSDYEKLCADHMARYGSDIQELINRHRESARAIRNLISSLATDMDSLDRMVTSLNF